MIRSTRQYSYPTIFEILPLQPDSEQVPATRLRPFDIVNISGLDIGPYVLHFKQNPSYSAMPTYCSTYAIIWTIRYGSQSMIKH